MDLIKRMSRRELVMCLEFLKGRHKFIQVHFFVCLRGRKGNNFFHATPIKEKCQGSPTTSSSHHVGVDTHQKQLNGTTDLETMAKDVLKASRLSNRITTIKENLLYHVSPGARA